LSCVYLLVIILDSLYYIYLFFFMTLVFCPDNL
jgi:hypothetical protein